MVTPQPQDVLCGKTKECLSHDGSIWFRSVIESYSDRYDESQDKYSKMLLTREIYDVVVQRGRFLKYNEEESEWQELSPAVARDKVGHALRFSAKKRKKRMGGLRSISRKVSDRSAEELPVLGTGDFQPSSRQSGTPLDKQPKSNTGMAQESLSDFLAPLDKQPKSNSGLAQEPLSDFLDSMMQSDQRAPSPAFLQGMIPPSAQGPASLQGLMPSNAFDSLIGCNIPDPSIPNQPSSQTSFATNSNHTATAQGTLSVHSNFQSNITSGAGGQFQGLVSPPRLSIHLQDEWAEPQLPMFEPRMQEQMQEQSYYQSASAKSVSFSDSEYSAHLIEDYLHLVLEEEEQQEEQCWMDTLFD